MPAYLMQPALRYQLSDDVADSLDTEVGCTGDGCTPDRLVGTHVVEHNLAVVYTGSPGI
jgi:hypothetical protein